MTWLRVFDHYAGQFKYARQIALGCLLALAVVGVYFVYRWYEGYRTEQAHGALMHAIELFERAEQENTKVLWDETDRAFSQGYSQNSGSTLAPYFLAFQSEIAVRQGDATKARDILEKAVSTMPLNAPLYTQYAVKLALMQIESGNSDLVEKGNRSLQTLSQHGKNRDMALYQQGLLLFEKGDRSGAQKIWNHLIGSSQSADSIWTKLAQAKLDYSA